jgi:hypothetical protein
MEKRRSQPISRILSAFALQASRPVALRRDDHSSRPGIARGLQRPTRQPRTGRPFDMPLSLAGRPHVGAALFGLAPCGVLPATTVTGGAVRSYRTISPLPSSATREVGRYLFCATVPSDCSARALPGALPSGVRTFLPPPPFRLRRGKPGGPLTVTRVRKPAIVWPTTTLSIIARRRPRAAA